MRKSWLYLCPMVLRYVLLFGGIVMIITGCNSLVSQQFGTHSLQEFSAEEVVASGVGDADFVSVEGLTPLSPGITVEQKGWFGLYCAHVFPLLTPEQGSAYSAGKTVSVNVFGWIKSDALPCQPANIMRASDSSGFAGLVNDPLNTQEIFERYAEGRILTGEPAVFLQIGERPMAWYWNLLLMVIGLSLAIIPEAFSGKK